MKLFPRSAWLVLGAFVLTGMVSGILGCQSNPRVPPVVGASPVVGDGVREPAFTPPPIIVPVPTELPPPTAASQVNLPLASPRVPPEPVMREPRPVKPSLPTPRPAKPFSDAELYLHLPPQASQRQPLRILLILHGMGSRGDAFAQALIPDADRNGWLIVAPNLPYGDYMNPAQILFDDLLLARRLADTLDALPKQLNLKFRQHVLIYGFSRGAQLAHRFALFFPERVETAAIIAAGTYTLPTEKNQNEQTILPLPYGIGDLETRLGHPLDWQWFKNISFWVAVGEKDNLAGDVPRAFDPYVGKTRVARAIAFEEWLRALGMDSRLVIFPNTGHEVTPEMRASAVKFLREDELKDHWDD